MANTIRNVLLEVKSSDAILASATLVDRTEVPVLTAQAISGLPDVEFDTGFGCVEIPRMDEPDIAEFSPSNAFDLERGRSINEDHKTNTYLMRATVDDSQLSDLGKQVKSARNVVAIYADPEIQVCDPLLQKSSGESPEMFPQICPGSPPLGTDRHVAARLGVPMLHQRSMDGRGVYVAVVDTGINLRHLRMRGKRPILDAGRSWMARAGDTPGNLPVSHGTMVAYDTMIAAPRATLLDIALLRSTRSGGSVMAGLLSDAIRAYVHLYRIIRGPHRPGAFSSMVVNNSWGMFHESWDFPPGHPGRYADNPAHPFNRIVGVLDHAGADILFAAGNCGRECPDGRCQGITNAGIYGANSHPQVLSVAGVDVLKRRVGYSTSGPGKLSFMKPDLCGYTHFRGSGVYPADGGTSAATPVVAGLVAAFRSRFAYNPVDFRTSPAAIRNLLTRTAEDRGSIGFDFDYGWGIANGQRLALIRSLSVMKPQEEAASSIEELTDMEQELNSIEGLDQVPQDPEEILATASQQELSTTQEEDITASIIGEYQPPLSVQETEQAELVS
jgi:hypothetical protein